MLINLIKIYKYYKLNGLFKIIKRFFSIFLSVFFKFYYKYKIFLIGFYKTKKIFYKKQLLKSDDGYYFLDSMPTKSELKEFYNYYYWGCEGFRASISSGVSVRDILHLKMLDDLSGEFFKTPRLILNFGSGSGGISHLMRLRGHEIINIDFSKQPETYSDRWKTIAETEEIMDKQIDFIYCSHSLEHVQNIKSCLIEFKRILKDDHLLFIEVPNAEYKGNGVMLNKIDIPHTYYFTKLFFLKKFKSHIICDSFNKNTNTDNIDNWKNSKLDKAEVIRFLGSF